MRLSTVTAMLTVALLAALLAPTTATAAGPADGFLYGRVTTVGGTTYEGFLRWGGEEAFWGDLFNSAKDDNRFARDVPRRERSRRRPVEVFGIRIGVGREEVDPSRLFVARFGDIARIKVVGSDDAEVTMKSGTTFAVSGSANDVEADVLVRDASVGEIEVPWRKIDTVELLPAPAGAEPYAQRLWGRVATSRATFEGFIQWDSEECLTSDVLDGDSEDGRLRIEMGRIKAIERRSRRSATVELADGRSIVLDGTNDVDSSIRGIMVEDPRYGRVKISWDAFERVDFGPAPGSGPSYASFAPAGPLTGVVSRAHGEDLRGRIVFDIDESEGWEILHGDAFDVEYLIPFSLVAAVEPERRDESTVTLRSGEKLRLADSQDVSARNAGVLVYPEGEGRPDYVPWDEVRRIEFSK